MKKISFILIISMQLIGLHSSSCKYYEDPLHLKIVNNSTFSIYYALSYSYPDTSLTSIENIPYDNKNKTGRISANESLFVRTIILQISDTTQMFIFDAHTIETTPWDSIVKYSSVLKRYQLTISDVERNNWTITYP